MISRNVMLGLLFISWTFVTMFGLSPNCSYATNSTKWILTGVCTVVSEHQTGWCQIKISHNPIKIIDVNLIGNKTSQTRHYFWNCTAEMNLPFTVGSYLYEVEFAGNKTLFHAFTVRIEDPGQPILKNCPEEVTEGKSVTCECSSERDGEPHPVLSWPGHTDSSILKLYDSRISRTYMCEMIWGKQKRNVSYSLKLTTDNNGLDTSTNYVVHIIGVVVAAAVVIIVTTVVVTVIIRRKNVRTRTPSNPRLDGVEIIENNYYGDFQLEATRGFNSAGNDYVDSNIQGRKTIQPDIYAAVEKDGGRQTQEDVYAVVEKKKRETPRDIRSVCNCSQVKREATNQGRQI